jgi:hypothetical protein
MMDTGLMAGLRAPPPEPFRPASYSGVLLFDATTAKFVVRTLSAAWCRDDSLLTSPWFSSIKAEAAVAATRGDLGQLAPRKKLLKSF